MFMTEHMQFLKVTRGSNGYTRKGDIHRKGPFKTDDITEDKITSSVQNSIKIENYTNKTLWYIGDSHSIIPIESSTNNASNHVGVWVLCKRQINKGSTMQTMAIAVTHILESMLDELPTVFGIISPIFTVEASAKKFLKQLNASLTDLTRGAPSVMLRAPKGYRFNTLAILQLGVMYRAKIVQTDEVKQLTLEVVSGNIETNVRRIPLKDIESVGYEYIKLDDYTQVIVAQSESKLDDAKINFGNMLLEEKDNLKRDLAKKLSMELRDEQDAHKATKRALNALKQEHEKIIARDLSKNEAEKLQLKKEELLLKQEEQKEKTKRSVNDTTASVSKSTAATASASSSLLSTSLTIGASVLTIAAIALPVFGVGAGIVAGIAGGIGKVLGAIGCIFGF